MKFLLSCFAIAQVTSFFIFVTMLWKGNYPAATAYIAAAIYFSHEARAIARSME